MASIEQARREAVGGVVGFFGALGAALRGLGAQRAGYAAGAEAGAPAEQSELFARAICEDSNSAMDWLYYAAQLRDGERRHCIRRALELSYGDEVVMGEVRRLRWG